MVHSSRKIRTKGAAEDVGKLLDVKNTIFLTNFEDRGEDNLAKKKYMSALTCDKMKFYEPKIDKQIDEFINAIINDGKPVLSTWFDRVLDFFFVSTHIGFF